MSDDAFMLAGSRTGFGLEVRLLPDPDGDLSAPAASAGSWGQWRLWVNGLNLCEHTLRLDDGELVRQESVTWYLAPLFRWLAGSWAPLLHEEKLPGQIRPGRAGTGRDAYLSVLRTAGDNPVQFQPWQDWGSRHSLRWASEGGMVPDLFLRRMGDDIEISWGDRLQPGGEAAEFQLETGVAHVPAADVALAVNDAFSWFLARPSMVKHPWFDGLRKVVEERPAGLQAGSYRTWYLDCQPSPGRLTALFEAVRRQPGVSSHRIFDDVANDNFIARLSPAAAMFGALSPDMSEEAATHLLAIVDESFESHQNSHPIDRFVTDDPAWHVQSPWDDGYRLARDFLEDMNIDSDAPLILPSILGRLQTRVLKAALGRAGPRGVAIAGDDLAPTIVINTEHPMNRSESGHRFTMAHELCHLLHDRDRARRVTHGSTPWAPASVEQRANAFAAMLLMPPALVHRALANPVRPITLASVVAAAGFMNVGIHAAIRHFANIGEISGEDRDWLLSELENTMTGRNAGIPIGVKN